jgi:hypothetical protein
MAAASRSLVPPPIRRQALAVRRRDRECAYRDARRAGDTAFLPFSPRLFFSLRTLAYSDRDFWR